MLPELLNVLDELGRVVLDQTPLQILGGVGLRLARAPLVEDDDAEERRIEEASRARRNAAARPTM